MQEVIEKLMAIDGVTAAAVVNAANGMTLVKAGGTVNLDIAGAACTELLRAAVKTMKVVGNAQPIEDLLLVAGNQYHLIQPITARPNHFVYLIMSTETGNFPLARMRITEIEAGIKA